MTKLNFTILLTLYDRHEDTKYWLEENIFEDINYFIADGSLYNHNQKLFKELKYKNVTYKRFAYDASTIDYLNKLKKSLSEIKTKYVMINDNDDFLVKDGVKQIVSFLNDNSEYNICSGKIFYIQKSLKFINKYYFNLNSLNNYGYKDYSFNESLKRYLSKLNGCKYLWYSVYETNLLVKIVDKLILYKIYDWQNIEIAHTILSLKYGRFKYLNMCHYVRQTTTRGVTETMAKNISMKKTINRSIELKRFLNLIIDDSVGLSFEKIERMMSGSYQYGNKKFKTSKKLFNYLFGRILLLFKLKLSSVRYLLTKII